MNLGEWFSLTHVVSFPHGVFLNIAGNFCSPEDAGVCGGGGGGIGCQLPRCSEQLQCSWSFEDFYFHCEDTYARLPLFKKELKLLFNKNSWQKFLKNSGLLCDP